MNKHNSPPEIGQIAVVFMLTIIALLAFTALALDGGLIYVDRRRAQMASDAASLAGGGAAGRELRNLTTDFQCSLSTINQAKQKAKNAGVSQASQNEFTLSATSADTPGDNQIAVECVDTLNGILLDSYLDIKVKVASVTETTLSNMFFSGPVTNEVETITRVHPPLPLAEGFAIVGLSPDCSDGGISFDGGGSQSIEINGGGIYSNSCIDVDGSANDICVDQNPDGSCDGDGRIFYKDSYTVSGSPTVSPAPAQTSQTLPSYSIPVPDCSSLPVSGDHSGPGTISPGQYASIKLSNGSLDMQPGLYCISGDLDVTGGIISGNGVTIFLSAGGFKSNGNAVLDLHAPVKPCAVCPPAIPGMVIYMGPGNTNPVDLRGTSDSSVTGTIYAPESRIDIGGSPSVQAEYNVQLIGWTVRIHGNVSMDVNYNSDNGYIQPIRLNLLR